MIAKDRWQFPDAGIPMIAKDRWQSADARILGGNKRTTDANSDLHMGMGLGGELTSIWLLPPGLLPLAGGARAADVAILMCDRLESISRPLCKPV